MTQSVLLSAPAVRRRYNNLSDMGLWRWLRDPELGFPQPIYIRKRRYWQLGTLEAWERARDLQTTGASDAA